MVKITKLSLGETKFLSSICLTRVFGVRLAEARARFVSWKLNRGERRKGEGSFSNGDAPTRGVRL